MRWRSAALLPLLALAGCGGGFPDQQLDAARDVREVGEEGRDGRLVDAPRFDLRRATIERDDGEVRVDVDLTGAFPKDAGLGIVFADGDDPVGGVTAADGVPARFVDGRYQPDERVQLTRQGSRVRLTFPDAGLAEATSWGLFTFSLAGEAYDQLPDDFDAGESEGTHPEITVIR